jgi:hypothetical protein
MRHTASSSSMSMSMSPPGTRRARDDADDAPADAPPSPSAGKPSATARMREAERGMELLAMTRARAAYARDCERGAVIMGVAKPGEDGWVRDRAQAGASTNAGGEAEGRERAGASRRFDFADAGDDDGTPTHASSSRVVVDANIADDAFKRGVACLKRGDVREALEAFELAEASCPLDMTDARTKLLRTITQTRALLAQDSDEGDDDDDDGGGAFDGGINDVANVEDDGDTDEFASVDDETDDEGRSETASEADANLADDAYRAAIWLLTNASDGAPPDYEEIENLLLRARALCPPSQATAIKRIDDLLGDLAALSA